MARYRLELGPVPLHHQVYLDLKAAIDSGEIQGRRPPPARARARPAVRLPPDHDPPRPRRALAGGAARARPGPGTFVLPPRLDATSRMLSRSPRRCSAAASTPRRGSSRRAPRPPARPSPRRSSCSPAPPPCTSSGSGSPAASRCCSRWSTCRRSAFPASSPRDLEHDSLYDTPHRALRHAPWPGRARPSSRCCSRRARHAFSGSTRGASPCSWRASPSPATARRSSSGGRTSAETGPATTSNASSSGPAPAGPGSQEPAMVAG